MTLQAAKWAMAVCLSGDDFVVEAAGGYEEEGGAHEEEDEGVGPEVEEGGAA